MPNPSFNIGDVVVLKSGGPRMTVYLVEGDEVSCEWFDDKRKVQQNTFHSAQLELVKET